VSGLGGAAASTAGGVAGAVGAGGNVAAQHLFRSLF
jgi:hypothetical protein